MPNRPDEMKERPHTFLKADLLEKKQRKALRERWLAMTKKTIPTQPEVIPTIPEAIPTQPESTPTVPLFEPEYFVQRATPIGKIKGKALSRYQFKSPEKKEPLPTAPKAETEKIKLDLIREGLNWLMYKTTYRVRSVKGKTEYQILREQPEPAALEFHKRILKSYPEDLFILSLFGLLMRRAEAVSEIQEAGENLLIFSPIYGMTPEESSKDEAGKAYTTVQRGLELDPETKRSLIVFRETAEETTYNPRDAITFQAEYRLKQQQSVAIDPKLEQRRLAVNTKIKNEIEEFLKNIIASFYDREIRALRNRLTNLDKQLDALKIVKRKKPWQKERIERLTRIRPGVEKQIDEKVQAIEAFSSDTRRATIHYIMQRSRQIPWLKDFIFILRLYLGLSSGPEKAVEHELRDLMRELYKKDPVTQAGISSVKVRHYGILKPGRDEWLYAVNSYQSRLLTLLTKGEYEEFLAMLEAEKDYELLMLDKMKEVVNKMELKRSEFLSDIEILRRFDEPEKKSAKIKELERLIVNLEDKMQRYNQNLIPEKEKGAIRLNRRLIDFTQAKGSPQDIQSLYIIYPEVRAYSIKAPSEAVVSWWFTTPSYLPLAAFLGKEPVQILGPTADPKVVYYETKDGDRQSAEFSKFKTKKGKILGREWTVKPQRYQLAFPTSALEYQYYASLWVKWGRLGWIKEIPRRNPHTGEPDTIRVDPEWFKAIKLLPRYSQWYKMHISQISRWFNNEWNLSQLPTSPKEERETAPGEISWLKMYRYETLITAIKKILRPADAEWFMRIDRIFFEDNYAAVYLLLQAVKNYDPKEGYVKDTLTGETLPERYRLKPGEILPYPPDWQPIIQKFDVTELTLMLQDMDKLRKLMQEAQIPRDKEAEEARKSEAYIGTFDVYRKAKMNKIREELKRSGKLEHADADEDWLIELSKTI